MTKARCLANTAALKATVAAAKVDVNVWKFNATDDRWVLYTGPTARSASSKRPLVWLVLQDKHYKLLQATSSLPVAVDTAWWGQALPCPDIFTGGGGPLRRGGKSVASAARASEEADARSFLGIPQSSRGSKRGAASTQRARGFLGISEAGEPPPVLDEEPGLQGPGAHLRCPTPGCGWKPTADTRPRRLQEARVHWRYCV
eukprot:4210935-Pyramimonas_sp.AAC.1